MTRPTDDFTKSATKGAPMIDYRLDLPEPVQGELNTLLAAPIAVP